ncbi:tyrosine-protein phosphatase [Promicromonospora vindobonensis]|uniref:Tyrosine-protein phosphatase n=1 Tax=Promicromonospora vindobonensis TaxID=195748 RepID=A0ABW5VW41_9MICO
MTTADIDVELSAPVNLRDLGGISITGGVLRHGLAVRADDLSIVTEAAARELVDGGLTAVIDLRSPEEVAITGRGPFAGYPVAYHHLPLIPNVSDSMSASMPKGVPVIDHTAMGQMYVGMVEGAAPQLVTALNVIAHAPGATAFHCAAGRDRTGVLAAVLLLVLGATDDDIVTDYARTGANMTAIMERTRGSMGVLLLRLGLDVDAQRSAVVESDGQDGPMETSMRILLATLRERHGDALGPLRAAGLGDDTIARLRQRALAA